MKRLFTVILFCSLTLSLFGCTPSDAVIDSLPTYRDMVMYTEGGFQDYTDYAIYNYSDLDVSVLDNSIYFQKISTSDVENILSYIENFEEWVEVFNSRGNKSELATHYAFDETIIDENDYIYIKTKEGTAIGNSTYGKFDNYSIYFFDVGTSTLYYFHNNI